jgi:hypothetical protein
MVAEAADIVSEPVTVLALSVSDPVTVKLLPKKVTKPEPVRLQLVELV